MLELLNFCWDHIITQVPASAVLATQVILVYLGGRYFRTKLNDIKEDNKEGNLAMTATVQALKKELDDIQESANKTYAKLSDVQDLRREMASLRDGMQTGFSNVNAQLTQISAAIINAVSK